MSDRHEHLGIGEEVWLSKRHKLGNGKEVYSSLDTSCVLCASLQCPVIVCDKLNDNATLLHDRSCYVCLMCVPHWWMSEEIWLVSSWPDQACSLSQESWS